MTPQETIKVALCNPAYLWRTVDGICKETGLERILVRDILNHDDQSVMISDFLTEDNEALYAWRDHYLKNAGFWRKLRWVMSKQLY